MNSFQEVINDLERQKRAIENALAALRVISEAPQQKRRGRPPGSATKRMSLPKKQVEITAEGRRRLAESMKKQWAVKRAAKKAATKAVSKPRGKRTAQKKSTVKKATPKKAAAKQPGSAPPSE